MRSERPTALPRVGLRPCTDEDLEFLYRVYAASRAEEMAVIVDWTERQKEAFLRFQFQAQHSHYRVHYPDAHYDIIVEDCEDVGRLYVAAMPGEIRLMDIALVPERRGRGLGGALVGMLLEEAERAGKSVSLCVEEHNPARRLYERMGFIEVGELGLYKLMRWAPPIIPLEGPGTH